MKERYGFAEYPLRDPEGQLIPDGEDLKATYPWMDRAGNNLFFQTISSTLWYRDSDNDEVCTRYPVSCVSGTSCGAPETADDISDFDAATNTRGLAVAGLWTHGKMVLLDNLLNHIDYGLPVPTINHRMIDLYQKPGENSAIVSVRVGSGRDNKRPGWPVTSTINTTFVDYVCYHDNATDVGTHLGNIPTDTASIRKSVIFPEGKFVWNQPRPDSSTNAFCLGCHVDGQRESLSIAALTLDANGRKMASDRRRQPLQPPRLIFGNVPAQHISETGLPESALQLSLDGWLLDRWCFPNGGTTTCGHLP